MAEAITVAVVGIGNVGFEVAKAIAGINLPADAKYAIDNLVLCSTNPERTGTDTKTITGIAQARGTSVSFSPLEKLADIKPEIIVNCASVPGAKKTKNRREMGELNLELNREICRNIPENSLYMIVTNYVARLVQDSILTMERSPEKTIGNSLVDSIRARIMIESYAREASIEGKLDTSNVFTIGDHDDGKIILATTSTVNGHPVSTLDYLKGRFREIETAAADFAHEQIRARGATGELTALAVVENLEAILENRSTVCMFLCDFNRQFFNVKLDDDEEEFTRPENEVCMSIMAGFKNLNAGFFPGRPRGDWFARQSAEVKRRFYAIAAEQNRYFLKLVRDGKMQARKKTVTISPQIIIPKEKPAENYHFYAAVNTPEGGFVYEFVKGKSKAKKLPGLEGQIKRIGVIDGELYAATRNSVWFDYNIISGPDYEGIHGINSFVAHRGGFFAAHHELGLLSSADRKSFRQCFDPPARELIMLGNVPVFASGNAVRYTDGGLFFKTPDEIVSLATLDDRLCISSSSSVYLPGKTTHIRKELENSGSVLSSTPFMGGFAVLTEKGIFILDCDLEKEEFYKMEGMKKLAGNGKSLLAYNKFMIQSPDGAIINPRLPENSEIASLVLI